MSLSWEVA